MNQNKFDIIIAGGGVMGAATAYNLMKRDASLRVLVIEKDASYVRSSTITSDGNTRVQFNLKPNIEISLYGLEVVATFDQEFASPTYQPGINFRQQGNLFTVDHAGREFAQQGIAVQKSMGCDVKWLEPNEISDYHPLFRPQANIAGATLGVQDGTMSPLDILMGYRHKSIELGATYVEGAVASFVKDGQQMSGVTMQNGDAYDAPIVINAAGAWSPALSATVGVELPITSIKREVYFVENNQTFEEILPMILLPNGQYVFHEGGSHYVTGGARAEDPATDEDFSWHQDRFETHMWQGLVEYLPAFDQLKVLNGWAGLYAVNDFDKNAILGEWPTVKGHYCVTGFSGHGFQQCHGVGRYMAELILGEDHAIDLSVFAASRILENKPVYENPNRLI